MNNHPSPINRARDLRQKMTPEEKIMWANLRNRKYKGLKFLRQHPIIYDTINNRHLFFIADFYCAEKKLVIELDGKIHESQKEYDERRDEILSNIGLKLLRIKNEDLDDIYAVFDKIGKFV